MKEDSIRQPVQLIDEDLDAVAGGDFNIAEIEQQIDQFQLGFKSDQDQSAANVAAISQSND
jgi:hypothetical protein